MKLRFIAKNDIVVLDANMEIFRKNAKFWKLYCDILPVFSIVSNQNDMKVALSELYAQKRNELNACKLKYISYWKFYKDKILDAISSIFNCIIDDEIIANISLAAIYTNNKSLKEFLLPFNADKERFLGVCIHEILHYYIDNKKEIETFFETDEVVVKILSDLVSKISRIPFFASSYVFDENYLEYSKRELEPFISAQDELNNAMLRINEYVTNNNIKLKTDK